MRKLSEKELERIVSLLKEGKPLPEHYKAMYYPAFNVHEHCNLIY